MILLLTAALLAQATPSAAQDVVDLHNDFLESIDLDKKSRALEDLARTPIKTSRDAHAAHDLFMRFVDAKTRNAVMDSLDLMDPRNRDPEPVFLGYLSQPEAESVLFGIKGSLRLRSPQALLPIKRIAEKKFAYQSPGETPLTSEKNAWWVQYEALSALAQWQGDKALPLLIRKTNEAPAIAQIMARYLWKESLPQFVKWSGQERANEGLRTQVPMAALKETRLEMLNILRDPKADKELRHQCALKLGISSNEELVAELLKEYAAQSDPRSRLYFEAALFASRSRLTLPLLMRHAKESPDAQVRAGVRVQLKEMLEPAPYRELLEWAAQNETDQENKNFAAEELKSSP
ncbi:MAG: hypothetical protein A3J74_01155 [Elusimicrobia bacterium RIFCSPHIGHO2_02_FULL_57_9]|nr:MAG: hypothetical protein A3J74_01155 [Elusimicrobia bacterium RIFCSPHIGHO2_02_FULL_57_9]